MDRVINIADIIEHEINEYVGPLYKGTLYPIFDHSSNVYSLLAVPHYPKAFQPGVILLARIVGDKVILDVDTTDRPLVNALVEAGIPREKIVLAYAGDILESQE
jgi:hypothetical protein